MLSHVTPSANPGVACSRARRHHAQDLRTAVGSGRHVRELARQDAAAIGAGHVATCLTAGCARVIAARGSARHVPAGVARVGEFNDGSRQRAAGSGAEQSSFARSIAAVAVPIVAVVTGFERGIDNAVSAACQCTVNAAECAGLVGIASPRIANFACIQYAIAAVERDIREGGIAAGSATCDAAIRAASACSGTSAAASSRPTVCSTAIPTVCSTGSSTIRSACAATIGTTAGYC